jgi:spermidine synthase
VRTAIVSGVLFLSGVSALIFETLWLRLSGLAFGNSVWSAALILSSFMAGLALGSAIAATNTQRLRPLRLYALLELTIAVLGCTMVFGIPVLGEWMRPAFQALWGHDTALNGLRLVLSFLILVVPTTAMGLTLPVLLNDPVLRRQHFGRVIGLLYGCNTLGAVAGAVVGEMYLVEAFGLRGTALAAGLLNCVAAILAWALASATRADPESTASTPPPQSPERADLARWRPLLVSFGAGFLLLCLELVWFRFLRLYVASSSTAFSVMLAVVLAGIGLGGLASGTMQRRGGGSSYWLPAILVAACIATLLCYASFRISFLPQADFYLDSWWEIALLSVLLMFPTAFLSGIVFPFTVASVQAVLPDRMNSTGIATLFNTTGAAAGPLLATFVLLPNLGFQTTLVACAIAYLLLAVVASDRAAWSVKQPRGLVVLTLSALAVLMIAIFPYHREEAHFSHARQPFETDGSQLIKKIEGNSDTLQLLRRDLLGEPYYYRLVTNAFTMSDTRYQNQRYMRLFAYLPLTLRPESEDALLICYGCGVTASALIHDPHLKRIDIVDISKEVFELANDYVGPNYSNPLLDNRVTKFVQDGRFFLQASARRYDVITGEPPPPKIAGTVNLYTEEFFALMNARLKDGGIATFWLPINQLKVAETKAILRAFHNAFPNASVWANPDYEWIMMGIKGPGRKLEPEERRRWWNDSATSTDLNRIGIEVPEQLPALFLMDAAEIERFTNGVKPLSDFYPKRLSDTPADLVEVQRLATDYLEAAPAARRFRSSPLREQIWPDTTSDMLDPFFVLRETRYLSETKGSNRMAELDLYLRHFSLRTPILEVLDSEPFRLSIAERVAHQSPLVPVQALPDLVAGALAARDFSAAIRLLEVERAQGFAKRNDLLLLTYVYCLNGNVEKAEDVAKEVVYTPKDKLVDWLWGTLQAEFGFRPPR